METKFGKVTGMKYVSKEGVIGILKEWTSLKGAEKLGHTTPGHGNCCTCQTCGHHHVDCVCSHNTILEALNNLPTIESTLGTYDD